MVAKAAVDRKTESITLRTSPATLQVIDQGARAAGKSRSDFMLEAARREAEEALLDRTFFVLNDEDWEAFNKALDNPPPSERFKELMRTPDPWD